MSPLLAIRSNKSGESAPSCWATDSSVYKARLSCVGSDRSKETQTITGITRPMITEAPHPLIPIRPRPNLTPFFGSSSLPRKLSKVEIEAHRKLGSPIIKLTTPSATTLTATDRPTMIKLTDPSNPTSIVTGETTAHHTTTGTVEAKKHERSYTQPHPPTYLLPPRCRRRKKWGTLTTVGERSWEGEGRSRSSISVSSRQ